MRKIHCLNPISKLGTGLLTENYEMTDNLAEAEGILVRSAAMHDLELPKGLRAVARAGAGVNNIPLDKCAEAGVVVFNTPGANANGVKELVLAGMLLGARDVVGGIDWCKEQKDNENISKDMEKAKKKLPVMRSAAKSLVLSDWAPSAQRLQTQLQRLAWKYTAMTRLFLSRQRGCFPET